MQIKNNPIFEKNNLIKNFIQLEEHLKTMFIDALFIACDEDLIEGCFRSYDIRIHHQYLPNHILFYLGLKIIPLLKKYTQTSEKDTIVIGVGRSANFARPSSERIHSAYINGLIAGGAKIIDLNVTSTPEAYFASAYLIDNKIKCVINITASHNPKHDNGIKHCIKTNDGFIHSVSFDQMNEIKSYMLKNYDMKLKSDQSARQNLQSLKDFYPCTHLESIDNSIYHYHNIFVTLFGYLGEDFFKALNLKNNKNFKHTLSDISPSAINKNQTIRQIVDELFKHDFQYHCERLGISNIQTPSHYKKDYLKDFVIIIDYGKGSHFRSHEIFHELGALVICIDKERGFNPMEEKNLIHLREKISQIDKKYPLKEVLGFAHDEDGDRLLVMRRDGQTIPGDRLLVILSKLIKTEPNKKPVVITEVKSRPETRQAMINSNIECIVTPTGFAFIKDAAIKLEKALIDFEKDTSKSKTNLYSQEIDLNKVTPVKIWGELSGHFGMSHSLSYFFDDSSLIAIYLLTGLHGFILKGNQPGQILINQDESFKKYPTSGELNIFVNTYDPHYIPSLEDKQACVDQFNNFFKNHPQVSKIDSTDGIQVFFEENKIFSGWILIRKSNNEDKLVIVTSAPSKDKLNHIEKELFSIAKKIKTEKIKNLVLTKDQEENDERYADPYIEKKFRHWNQSFQKERQK